MYKWVCLNEDTAKYRCQRGDYWYSFIMCRYDYDDGNFAVVMADIDLRDYSLADLERIANDRFDTLESMVFDFSVTGTILLLAEYLFDEKEYEESEFTVFFPTETEAHQYVRKWLAGPGRRYEEVIPT